MRLESDHEAERRSGESVEDKDREERHEAPQVVLHPQSGIHNAAPRSEGISGAKELARGTRRGGRGRMTPRNAKHGSLSRGPGRPPESTRRYVTRRPTPVHALAEDALAEAPIQASTSNTSSPRRMNITRVGGVRDLPKTAGTRTAMGASDTSLAT